MSWITLIGLFAATCTTLSFLPQVMKTIKTKNTRDISLGMYGLFTVGVLSWLVYGILTADLPIVIANAITILLAGIILILKIKYG
ncbi:hypothetical protein A3F27_01090 [Candidatus Kaiserbacteria bacterium RIFCSPHIGHO2_12_FULL_53_13]|uniref:Glutathione synthetase n=1 Tax=Candidatus Kaiserbacteria bacterium RIFCSPHIGHO2_12_FULL_53_13 TaxID=1798502 RepID=A0A1F6ECD0_9BACT|nr:MAG: hypothetical protein A3F27_01090 [Candidatus Kaiserbacteria bacterium RIFCSPHIGHO2_12_FULL_53_13]